MRNLLTVHLTKEVDLLLHRAVFLIDIPRPDFREEIKILLEEERDLFFKSIFLSLGIIPSSEANDGEIRTGELEGTKRLSMVRSVKIFLLSSTHIRLPQIPESIPVCGDPGLKRLPVAETLGGVS